MTDQQIDLTCRLSEWLAGTDITLLELSGPGRLIRLRRNGMDSPAEAVPQAVATTTVRAGSVGMFLHSHPLRAEPLVRVGQEVRAGQALALLRIGLVLLAVPSPRAGTVRRIVAMHEARVGFGDALIELA
jgi:acetyl-CoA carboxylase biotin carboxyl carrier protein